MILKNVSETTALTKKKRREENGKEDQRKMMKEDKESELADVFQRREEVGVKPSKCVHHAHGMEATIDWLPD